MLNFEYQNPTKVLFGTDSLQKLGKEILRFGDTALLVYSSGSVKTNGNYEKIVTPLQLRNRKIILPEVTSCGV